MLSAIDKIIMIFNLNEKSWMCMKPWKYAEYIQIKHQQENKTLR